MKERVIKDMSLQERENKSFINIIYNFEKKI